MRYLHDVYGWLSTEGSGTHAFMHAQCGLCATYGRDYRTRTRLLASTDPSILLLLIEALEPAPAARVKVRCPLTFMVASRTALAPQSDLQSAVAAIQVVLANEKLLDDRLDRDRWLARLAGRAFAADLARAEEVLAVRGFPLDELRAHLRAQPALEADPRADIDALAAPTGEGLGLIVASLAPEAARDHARTFARRLGRLLYLVDALHDFPHDQRHAKFNPLAAYLATPTPAGTHFVRDKLAGLIASVEAAFAQLPLVRHAAPLHRATVGALGRRVKEVLP